MTIPIPSGSPVNPLMDFRRNDLVTPPNAPTVIENLQAIDPRVALNMPTPVASPPDSAALRDSLAAGQTNNAVLLELSGSLSQQDGALDPLLAQSISKMDSLGGLALGQLLSDILLNQPDNLAAKNSDVQKNGQVAWPTSLVNKNNSLGPDLKTALNTLYQSLQNSGIFAADQLKKLLMPAGSMDEEHSQALETTQKQVSDLVGQLETENPSVKDAVKLLLRGDLLWQGQLTPSIQAKIYRSDAWEADSNNSGQLIKGSQLSMEINLPKLGKLLVIGTQFRDQLNIQLKVSESSNNILLPQFNVLLDHMHDQIEGSVKVSLMTDRSSTL